MHLKGVLEEAKKDKNMLSVALKSSKQNVKEIEKAFVKEKELFEKNTSELREFKRKKLNEEREERIRKKKDIKKAKKKNPTDALTKDSEDNTKQDNSEGGEESKKFEANCGKTDLEQENENGEDTREIHEIKDETSEAQIDENDNSELETFDANTDITSKESLGEPVEESEPVLMSEEEKEAFLKEIFANVDKAIENIWPGLRN